ncbi:MAG TPA: NAD(P)-binding protein [Pyrinomonadaceae bacterium]
MGNGSKKVDLRKAPRTDDERWKELLRLMAVPGHAGVYVLGCFARHVTFYSQQVRALNLIDALCKTGAVADGGSVGVVGAGLAGLTAAAAALRRGLTVHLFQEDDDPQNDPGRMPLQMNSDERWVDPFIYDWPLRSEAAGEESAAENVAAGLPLLDWESASPSDIRRQVLDKFKDIVAGERAKAKRGPDCISFHRAKVTKDNLVCDGDGRWQKLIEVDKASPPVAVDALILAVGFGVEDEPAKTSYWENDGLGSRRANDKSYLVSGAGDGGLTDVMRLCIADFKHRTVLDKFKGTGAIGERLKKAVREGRPELEKYFIREAANVEVSDEDLNNYLAPRKTDVYLASSPAQLFGAGSRASILNRLIVAWLFYKGRFRIVDARLRVPPGPGSDGSVEFARWGGDDPEPAPPALTFQNIPDDPFKREDDPAPHKYDAVIVRHGPGQAGAGPRRVSPLEACFPAFWEKSQENLSYWKEMPHWDDWTRRPVWGANDFAEPPPLDPPAVKGRTYLVVEHPKTEGIVRSTLARVIRRLHENDDADAPAPTLIPLNLDEEFENPHRFGRAVRALCRADVVVFDLSEEKRCPEAYVLLGIRSVARRGITIVTTRFKNPSSAVTATDGSPEPEVVELPPEPEESDAPFSVPELPFLLQDINFCGWGKKEDAFVTRLRRAIEEGRARADRLGLIYRDLPAYEEVRQLGPRPEDYRVLPPDEAVLFLCPLDQTYREKNGSWLKARAGAEDTGRYIVESPSPERTSIKLYNAIRRTQFCVVDWTQRRPNVFFELGVRLAASPMPPVCVIHKGEEWAKKSAKDEELAKKSAKGEKVGGIFNLFRPIVYDNPGTFEERERVEGEIQNRKWALGQKDPAAAWPLEDAATMSPSFVYEQVRAAVPAEEEDWNTPVWRELRKKADLILGSQPIQYPDPPILFGDDYELKTRAGWSGLDRLFAAWYFLERRHGIGKLLDGGAPLDEDAEPWKSWLDTGRLIRRLLKDKEADVDYSRMRDEVEKLLNTVKANAKASRGGTR